MTLTFRVDLDMVEMNQHAKYLGYLKSYFVRKLLRGHTHRTEFSTWTTKVIGNHIFVTGPPNIVYGPVLFCSLASVVVYRLSSSACRRQPRRACRRLHPRGQAMTSCRLQCNYSSTVILHGGPVVLRPVRASPCLFIYLWPYAATNGAVSVLASRAIRLFCCA